MLNHAQPLKSVLSQKVAQQAEKNFVFPAPTSLPEDIAPVVEAPKISLVLTLQAPLTDALPQLEMLQQLIRALGVQCAEPGKEQLPLANTPRQTVSLHPQKQASAKSPLHPLPMTDRQKRMIYSLVAKKRLSDVAVREMLEQEFGHQEGAKLTKSEASKLIDRLMAK